VSYVKSSRPREKSAQAEETSQTAFASKSGAPCAAADANPDRGLQKVPGTGQRIRAVPKYNPRRCKLSTAWSVRNLQRDGRSCLSVACQPISVVQPQKPANSHRMSFPSLPTAYPGSCEHPDSGGVFALSGARVSSFAAVQRRGVFCVSTVRNLRWPQPFSTTLRRYVGVRQVASVSSAYSQQKHVPRFEQPPVSGTSPTGQSRR